MPEKPNIYFYNKPIIQKNEFLDVKKLMLKTGGNTGNMFFMRSLERQLDFNQSGNGSLLNPKQVGDQFDSIAICAANWLSSSNKNLGDLARKIEDSKLPCLVAGLGAQSLDTTSRPKLPEGSIRFLKVVSERSHSIGVRGEFTAEVIAAHGIHNVQVVGCPSYFWTLNNTRTRKTLPAPGNSAHLRLAIHANRKRVIRRADMDAKLRVERQLYDEVLQRPGSFFVAQTERPECALGLAPSTENLEKLELTELEEYLDAKRSPAWQDKFRVFHDIEDWIAALRCVDGVIGTRLHGCLVGIAAGTPSMLITIDSRTEEMAKLFSLPHLPVASMETPLNLEKTFAETDFDTAIEKYPLHFEKYRSFLTDNKLPTRLN